MQPPASSQPPLAPLPPLRLRVLRSRKRLCRFSAEASLSCGPASSAAAGSELLLEVLSQDRLPDLLKLPMVLKLLEPADDWLARLRERLHMCWDVWGWMAGCRVVVVVNLVMVEVV